jgi:hypothetical protein
LDLYQRTILHDRAMPRTRLEALLWEAPLLLIGALMILVGILLMLGLIGSS